MDATRLPPLSPLAASTHYNLWVAEEVVEPFLFRLKSIRRVKTAGGVICGKNAQA